MKSTPNLQTPSPQKPDQVEPPIAHTQILHKRPIQHYNLVVIGSGPSGEKAAIQAAKLGKTVLLVEKGPSPGGNCVHSATIPSKTLRESALQYATLRLQPLYNKNVMNGENITITRLMHRKNVTVTNMSQRLGLTFRRNDINYTRGEATFVDEHTLRIVHNDQGEESISADFFMISTGSSPRRPSFLPKNNPRVLDSDTILNLDSIPRSISVFGGGVIGCEYASIFACLGVKVNLINPRDRLLDFLDREISTFLNFLMRDSGVRIRLGEDLSKVRLENGHVYCHTTSGKKIKAEYLLYANGRSGNTQKLGLEKLGLKVNHRAQIKVNAFYQTDIPHIYAAGDVIGFPSLASTSMEQGRLAMLHAFNALPKKPRPHYMPTGIYTIPEISTVGRTEEQLTKEKIPYEVGVSSYREITRSQITGSTATIGRIKLLFHCETHEVLGVHIIGESASDLIHIGQAVMDYGGKIEYFVDNVFNYPSFSEGYRLAALNGLNRL